MDIILEIKPDCLYIVSIRLKIPNVLNILNKTDRYTAEVLAFPIMKL